MVKHISKTIGKLGWVNQVYPKHYKFSWNTNSNQLNNCHQNQRNIQVTDICWSSNLWKVGSFMSFMNSKLGVFVTQNLYRIGSIFQTDNIYFHVRVLDHTNDYAASSRLPGSGLKDCVGWVGIYFIPQPKRWLNFNIELFWAKNTGFKKYFFLCWQLGSLYLSSGC